ncbi:hypothetical protein CWE13_02590 [Aliidiomarina shirensis]|uniref:Sel1 repeat family protein n=1 Tax=Aliidiomarina shirensis TaxID=1048642 RepID=A0A432WXN0_9GAMM|nr:tetratricopeptide repeat protein [Aliidiomarina shirensis]RUO38550.1 hypothetical protein CWE13_02590 [Aliidiomarina shirensis]
MSSIIALQKLKRTTLLVGAFFVAFSFSASANTNTSDQSSVTENQTSSEEKLCADGSCDPHIIMLHRLSRWGYQDAKSILAVMYVSGDGVEQDIEHGVYLMQSAAKHDGAMALFSLSKWHREGLNVEKDTAKADELLDRAVELEYPPAQYQKALYLFASEDEQLIGDATELLENAARKGSSPAMYLLARLKLMGEWVEYDLEGASNLLARLSREGHEDARALSRQLVAELDRTASENGELDSDTKEIADRLHTFANMERIQVTPMSFGRTYSAVSAVTFEMDRTFTRGAMSRIRTQTCGFETGCVAVRPNSQHSSLMDMLSEPVN